MAFLLSLKRQLTTAGVKQLAAISTEIAQVVASASSTARAAQQASTGSGQIAPGQASQMVREAVADFEDDYFKKRKFDAYLQFTSEEDERAFRERERERQAEIQKALAQHTPEGDLRAGMLAEEQLRDAGAHGADRSPDFQPLLDKVASSNAALATQVEATNGKRAEAGAPQKADPLDAPAGASSIPPELLASLRASGLKVPDQEGTGHGIAQSATKATERGSSVPL